MDSQRARVRKLDVAYAAGRWTCAEMPRLIFTVAVVLLMLQMMASSSGTATARIGAGGALRPHASSEVVMLNFPSPARVPSSGRQASCGSRCELMLFVDYSPASKIIVDQLTIDVAPGDFDIFQHVEQLSLLSKGERERFAYESGTRVMYVGEEVPIVVAEEEALAMRAVPNENLEKLNGLNLGRGGRDFNPYLVGTDAHRGAYELSYGTFSKSTMLALAHKQPFRTESLDFIVALHVLEHDTDPSTTVLHWLSLLRPGGGLGVVVPDWRFTWDSSSQDIPWAHMWNPEPSLIFNLWEQHWSTVATLEHLYSSKHAQNVDFVLRKHGTFVFIEDEYADSASITGKQLFCSGAFLGNVRAGRTPERDC